MLSSVVGLAHDIGVYTEQTQTLHSFQTVLLTWNWNIIPAILRKFSITFPQSVVFCKKESEMLPPNMDFFSHN